MGGATAGRMARLPPSHGQVATAEGRMTAQAWCLRRAALSGWALLTLAPLGKAMVEPAEEDVAPTALQVKRVERNQLGFDLREKSLRSGVGHRSSAQPVPMPNHPGREEVQRQVSEVEARGALPPRERAFVPWPPDEPATPAALAEVRVAVLRGAAPDSQSLPALSSTLRTLDTAFPYHMRREGLSTDAGSAGRET
jgi:hypothetical protein